MKRVSSGMYVDNREVVIDGKQVEAEFRVFQIKSRSKKGDTKNYLPLWAWDCPALKLLARDVSESKKDVVKSLNRSCEIGFKTVPMTATMLAIV